MQRFFANEGFPLADTWASILSLSFQMNPTVDLGTDANLCDLPFCNSAIISCIFFQSQNRTLSLACSLTHHHSLTHHRNL